MEEQFDEYDAARERRQRRLAEMKRKKKQQALFRKYFRFGAIGAVVFIAVLVVLIGNGISKRNKNKEQQGVQTETAELQAVAGTEAEESLPLADQKEPAEVQAAEPEENKIYEYTTKIELRTGGNYGYTFRVMPKHEMLLDSENLNLVKWITD